MMYLSLFLEAIAAIGCCVLTGSWVLAIIFALLIVSAVECQMGIIKPEEQE